MRPLRDSEVPPESEVTDRRMVEYGTESCGMVISDWFRFADPLRDLSLLERFTHLFGGDEVPADAEVVGFYATFGPLNETVEIAGERWPAWLGRLDRQAQELLLEDPMTRWSEPLWWLHERGREVRVTFQIYEHLRRGEFAGLRALFGMAPAGKRVVGIELAAGRFIRDVVDEDDIGRPGAGSVGIARQEVSAVSPDQHPRPLADEECVFLANRFLAQQLNLGEAGSRQRWESVLLPEEPDGPSPLVRIARVRFTTGLTAALYLHLSEAIEREAPIRQCQGCGRIFRVSRTDRIYCRAQCGDAARQRTYYRAQSNKPVRPRAKRRRR